MKVSVTITMSINSNKDSVLKLNKTDADFLHIDVMDGKFVPKTLFPYNEVKSFAKYNDKPLDIHLMVQDVKKAIKQFASLKPEYITFHRELDEDIMSIITYIHSFNIKAGLSIKPKTNVSDIEKYLPYLDQVLVMSVEPGQGGQQFMRNTSSKISELSTIRSANNYKFLISVDGGINDDTINLVKDADVVSVGSFVCMHEDYQVQINKLR